MEDMKIDIVGSAKDIDPDQLEGASVIVIDVLRATSVMVTAFENGVKEIIAVSSPDEAFEIKKNNKDVILGGERNADFIPGFDLDNSPFNYRSDIVSGKTLVMSTSNGTRAINGSLNARKLVVGSFLNASAVAAAIVNDKKVVLVCSGSNNMFTLEDSLCAGYIVSALDHSNIDISPSDFAIAMMDLYNNNKFKLHEIASKGNHYQILVRKGYQKDLDYCFEKDKLNVVPVYDEGRLILK